MLTKKQVSEIREHLEKAQNPIFFYDNDQDGLCSFLLLQKFVGGGKGVAVKSFPGMEEGYFKKVTELNADYIFILDKPVVGSAFWKQVEQINLPVVWIDHHGIQEEIPEFVNYYDPVLNKKSTNEPVTALCYQISQRKEDLWLAVVGCISDKFVPDFYSDFLKEYPDLAIDSDDAFKIFYESRIGKVARILGFGLKDRISSVVEMQKFLLKAKDPYDVLDESSKNYFLHNRFSEVDKKYQKLLSKAMNFVEKDLVFFQYGGDLSMSADLSNELSYKFPEKDIVVVRVVGSKANVSARGKKIREKVLKAIEGLEGATGGGHEEAVGAKVQLEDLEKFKERLESKV